MKVSELIKKLQARMDQLGDVGVLIETGADENSIKDVDDVDWDQFIEGGPNYVVLTVGENFE